VRVERLYVFILGCGTPQHEALGAILNVFEGESISYLVQFPRKERREVRITLPWSNERKI
jgi:hypothetical protein